MPTTLTLDVVDDAAPEFGGECVACGATADTSSTLLLERLVVVRPGVQRTRGLRWSVPHCAACARVTKSTFLAAFVPFALGFLVTGAAAFLAVAWGTIALGLDDSTAVAAPRTPASLVLGGLAGLVVGLVGGFLMELVARVLLLPWMGRALWRMPLFVPSLLTDLDAVAGLSVSPNADLSAVTLRFDRADAAAAFAAANRGARPVR